MAGAATAGELSPILLTIDSVTRVTDVARYRLGQHLAEQGCQANIRFDSKVPLVALMFRLSAQGSQETMALSAKNRDGEWPRPAWITRRTAGVRSVSELEARDLATVAGGDPLASALPLAALAAAGIHPEPERIYESGDFSSALGLLLHNNTHAAVSEAGFAGEFLERQDLVLTWLGAPVKTVGWYRGVGWSEQALACEEALGHLIRTDDKQAFAVFPEWVHGFAKTDDQ
ncbi:hypothetical protein [Marinobacter sp.]|uniref:hypothetical protein n=1 Tax=Marinobacter sp. TaxID=50741 RepID=UPI0025C1A7DC|nr:hypothetical protein [Marinobacter sp.]